MAYDVIIVGARCAGSPVAMLLAGKGYRVLMVDKATFPSDAISTHYIHQPGVERLARWGLLEKVVQSGCPAISNAQLDLGRLVLRGSTNREAGAFAAYAPRRRMLDKILFDAALDAGAEAREGFSVDEILSDGKRVTGIRGHAHGGSSVTEFAPLVVGADGMHSIVARAAAARAYNTRPTLTCAYFSYWAGVAMDHAEAYLRPGLVVAAWPTNDDLVVVFVAAPRDQFQRFRADVEGNWMARIDRLPRLADRIRAGRRVGRFSGSGDLPNFFRKPFGPGWALVGDAGYHRDPVTAQGITDAFRDADFLAEAVDEGFSGRQELETALAAYERRRNDAVRAMYQVTCHLAARQIPPGGQLLLRALRDNQMETDRFLGTLAGTTSISEFYSPANLLGIAIRGCFSRPKQRLDRFRTRVRAARDT